MAKEPRQKPDRQSKDGEKKKKGFSVGPANLPDGTYKRKVDKIKKALIRKAKVKKQYSKILAIEKPAIDPHALRAQKLFEEAEQERLEWQKKRQAEKSPAPEGDSDAKPPVVHPDRQAAMDKPEVTENPQQEHSNKRRGRKPKTNPYQKEKAYAQKMREERELAIKAAEERRKERERREKQREMRRRTVMSAKTRTGQFKIGKMSHMLLEKVQEQMAKD